MSWVIPGEVSFWMRPGETIDWAGSQTRSNKQGSALKGPHTRQGQTKTSLCPGPLAPLPRAKRQKHKNMCKGTFNKSSFTSWPRFGARICSYISIVLIVVRPTREQCAQQVGSIVLIHSPLIPFTHLLRYIVRTIGPFPSIVLLIFLLGSL